MSVRSPKRNQYSIQAPSVTESMKLAAAYALADACGQPTAQRILPDALDAAVAPLVANAVKLAWEENQE